MVIGYLLPPIVGRAWVEPTALMGRERESQRRQPQHLSRYKPPSRLELCLCLATAPRLESAGSRRHVLYKWLWIGKGIRL